MFDEIRPFFKEADIFGLEYPWDEWDSASYFMKIDESFAASIDTITDVAQEALILSTVEWICARHNREPRSMEVLSYIDAAWAALLSERSISFEEFSEDTWLGPVLGPLRYAQQLTVVRHLEDGHNRATLPRACWARNLVLHIIGAAHRSMFIRWTEMSVSTLNEHHQFEEPRWHSIFAPKFSNNDLCPPDAFSMFNSYDPQMRSVYADKHMDRVSDSRFLDDPNDA
ncbi:MAG: hypothetical protein AAF557_03105 [Pseudomonadota bacterium]